MSITFETNQDDSYKEKTSTPRKRGQPPAAIKASIPSQIKVSIIYPFLAF